MKMHFCTCTVNLAGQGMTFVDFYPQNPVSWPEVQVLMLVHGEENVTNIKPIALADVHPSREKERLARKYGWRAAEQVFPGRSFRMELLMPAETEELPVVAYDGLDGGSQKASPLDGPDDDHAGPLEPPAGPAVFKAGKHNPQKAAVEG
jgi:hypothetical protein